MWDEIISLLTFLIVFALVLYLAYAASKFFAQRASRSLRGKKLSVIETISLGVDKQIHLIRAGKEYFLISSSGKNINFLTGVRMDEEEGSVPEDAGDIQDNKSGRNLSGNLKGYAGESGGLHTNIFNNLLKKLQSDILNKNLPDPDDYHEYRAKQLQEEQSLTGRSSASEPEKGAYEDKVEGSNVGETVDGKSEARTVGESKEAENGPEHESGIESSGGIENNAENTFTLNLQRLRQMSEINK